MKIIYCIAATHNSGGMERVLANKANWLAGHGYDVEIITTDQRGRASYFPLDPRIRCHDLDINYTDNNTGTLMQKLWSYPAKQRLHLRRLTALLKERRADVVVSMFDHDVNLLHKINDGSKKVVEIHFSRFKRLQYGRKGLWRLVDSWRSRQDLFTAKRYDRFVVLTEEDKGYWGNLANMVVIPNAHSFDPPTVSALDQQRVIAVGRYDYQKGFDELIDVWAYVHAQCPDWRLDIFGQGELEQAYRAQIQDLGLLGSVRLRAPTADIEAEYLASSILAMTSRYEGLPMALLEAQACGLPLVSYACKCGPRDVIQDGVNGFLIDEGDKEAMAQALVRLMEDTELRQNMGKASKKMAARFSEAVVMSQWTELFQKL